jgi:hypothetical protein
MNRSLIIVLGALALGTAIFAGSYSASRRVCAMTNPADDLSWLRTEFHLTDAEMARIRRLHEGYLPQCAQMCARIAAKKQELAATLAGDTNVTADAQKQLAELGAIRAQCQAQMLQPSPGHFARSGIGRNGPDRRQRSGRRRSHTERPSIGGRTRRCRAGRRRQAARRYA